MKADRFSAFPYVGTALGTCFEGIRVLADLSKGRPAILARSLADLLTPESNSDMPTRLCVLKGEYLEVCRARHVGRKTCLYGTNSNAACDRNDEAFTT